MDAIEVKFALLSVCLCKGTLSLRKGFVLYMCSQDAIRSGNTTGFIFLHLVKTGCHL